MPVSRRADRPTLLLLGGMYALFLGNFALFWTRPLPLAVHVLIGAVAIHLAFTIWHEAAHRNVSGRRWLNETVGVLGIFPYITPYFLQKYVHLQHHARLNEPDDPNRVYADGSFGTIFLRYPRALRYARQVLAEDPRRPWERRADLAALGVVATVWVVAAWHGRFVDLVWLWAVPLVLAKLVMDWYVNWLPHVGLPADRFLGTRILDVPWLTPLVLAHNYHAIHHLWPRIPWHRYREVFAERRERLRAQGVPIEDRVLGFRRSASLATPGHLPR